MPPSEPSTSPRVVALLVVHNGEAWLSGVLATLARQRYPALDLVVVDNASRDGSADLLARHIPAERLITRERNTGFTRAVHAAAAHPRVDHADYVLLLHDDMVLADDAVQALVDEMERDHRVAIAGPKLRGWGDDRQLQSVGMTIDRFGRAETGLEPGEYDQGQRDGRSDTLYVPTAGMLVRRSALEELRGFDPRFPAYRDDLDLCWRAWLHGHRVVVVPTAVGYHLGAGRGTGRPGQSRYLAERHGLAAVLKNYGALRLAWVLPVLALLGLVKTAGFVVTRQLGAAAAVVRAYAWNLFQLPRTLTLRRRVQSARVVGDRELAHLFAPGLPRARSYLEAGADWLTGGSRTRRGEDQPAAASAPRRSRSPLLIGSALGVAYLFGLIPLLGPGAIVGGEVLPWPADPLDFFRSWAAAWTGDPAGSGAVASPIQAVLGAVSLAGLGSAWAAQRIVVLGLLPLAWLLALRAGRLVTGDPTARALGATVYVASPVVWTPLAQGRFGLLVGAALLPGLVLAGVRAVDRDTAPASAWRAAALLAVGLALVVAAAPGLAPLLAAGVVVGAVAALALRAWSAVVRMLGAAAAAAALVAPWLADTGVTVLVQPAGTGDPSGVLPLWRALLLVPDALPGPGGVAGGVAGVAAVALVGAAVATGLRVRPGAVVMAVTAIAAAALAAWSVARAGDAAGWTVWPPALLLPAALAYACLAALVWRRLAESLRRSKVGLEQVAGLVGVTAVVALLAVGVVRVAQGPTPGLERETALLPAFVAADVPRTGPYRVVLAAGGTEEVRWEVVDSAGPSMTSYGTTPDPELLDHLHEAVVAAIGGADPRAGQQLGLANVRYLVVADPADSAELSAALDLQPDLQPVPSGDWQVYRVEPWLPRAVVLDDERGQALVETGAPGATADVEEDGAARVAADRYSADLAAGGGLLVVSEATSSRWTVQTDAGPAERVDLAPVNAFALPDGATQVQAYAVQDPDRRSLTAVTVGALLLLASLMLRPPGSKRARAHRAGRRPPPRVSDPAAAPDRAAATDAGAAAPPPVTVPAARPGRPSEVGR